jgi:hypothetical protein
MSEQTRVSHLKEPPLSTDVEGFGSLVELALDMRSSWNHASDRVWRQLDPVLWELTHNPRAVLQTVSREKLRRDLADPAFRKTVDDLVRARRDASFDLQLADLPDRTLTWASLAVPSAEPPLLQTPSRHPSSSCFFQL